MKDQLVDKLRVAVSEDISKECQVVYILAESRKLLEKYPPDPIPFALKMYCHWALHVDLTSPGTTEVFLQRVDRFVDRFVERIRAGNLDVIEDERMFHEFAFWDTFRRQFLEFLSAYGLPTALCDDDRRWHDFLRHYARVVEDGSLRCRSKTQRLKYVDEVIIKKGRARPANNSAPFDLAWHIVLSNGRSLTVNVDTADFSNGSRMLVHGITMHWDGHSGFID
jgi:hypothetical protein